jgi:hypothetical protein
MRECECLAVKRVVELLAYRRLSRSTIRERAGTGRSAGGIRDIGKRHRRCGHSSDPAQPAAKLRLKLASGLVDPYHPGTRSRNVRRSPPLDWEGWR